MRIILIEYLVLLTFMWVLSLNIKGILKVDKIELYVSSDS